MICVECGQELEGEALYLEYSANNIKLVRCEKCQMVADKYIEYDLLLVSIDLILLCDQSYRHILFNRNILHKGSLSRIPSMALSVVLVNVILRMVAVEEWNSDHLEEYSFLYPVYLIAACVTEHAAFIGTVFFVLWRLKMFVPLFTNSSPADSSTSNVAISKDFHRKLYISLAFPEIFKLVVLLLQTWDPSPVVSLMAGFLCLSIQITSFSVAMSFFLQRKRSSEFVFIVLAGVVGKLCARICFHSLKEILLLGII